MDVEKYEEDDSFRRMCRRPLPTDSTAAVGELLGRRDQSPPRALRLVNALCLRRTFHPVRVQTLAHQLCSLRLEHLCDTAEEMSNKHINDTIIN